MKRLALVLGTMLVLLVAAGDVALAYMNCNDGYCYCIKNKAGICEGTWTANAPEDHFVYFDDVIYGTSGNDTISAHDGVDQVYGYQGSDKIYGGNGPDELHGDWPKVAGAGADYLNGGPGQDECYGDGGHDTFVSCEVKQQ